MESRRVLSTTFGTVLSLVAMSLAGAAPFTASPLAAPTPGGGSTGVTPIPPVVNPSGVVVLTQTYRDIALSQDGNDLYVSGSQFERYAVAPDGGLTLAQTWTPSRGFISQPGTLIAGPDDTFHVAVKQGENAGLAAFAPIEPRGPATYVSTLWNTQAWVVSPRQSVHNTYMRSADYTAISPDGQFAYVTPFQNVRLLVYRRAANGDLTAQPPLQTLDLSPVTIDPRAILISPDGSHLYVSYSAIHNLLAFSRNPTTGSLTWIQSLQFAPNVSANVNSLTISPDGRHVYALGYRHVEPQTPSLQTYNRDPASGLLTLAAATPTDAGYGEVALTHNGYYLLHFVNGTLTVYRRSTVSGTLTKVQTLAVTGLTGTGHHLVVSADDTFVLVGRGSAIIRLALNAACASQTTLGCP